MKRKCLNKKVSYELHPKIAKYNEHFKVVHVDCKHVSFTLAVLKLISGIAFAAGTTSVKCLLLESVDLFKRGVSGGVKFALAVVRNEVGGVEVPASLSKWAFAAAIEDIKNGALVCAACAACAAGCWAAELGCDWPKKNEYGWIRIKFERAASSVQTSCLSSTNTQ